MPIRIITDSASDMVSPQRQEVRVLPMTISFEGRQYQDGIDLEPVSTTCNHRLSGLLGPLYVNFSCHALAWQENLS